VFGVTDLLARVDTKTVIARSCRARGIKTAPVQEHTKAANLRGFLPIGGWGHYQEHRLSTKARD
jgi:hypothetical protein